MKKLGLLALLLLAPLQLVAQTVCAIVKIEIRQELSFERQAFDAKMVITNSLDIVDIEHLEIDVLFEDIDGNPVLASSNPDNTNARFFITVDSMQGVNAIDGSGVINAGTSAEIHWLIIPAAGAGGLTPSGLRYAVGATVNYTFGEESEVINVVPDFITVSPTPLLKLDYFLPTDVFGDDPFTDETESIEPFDLGLRISNTGAGSANAVKIESAQPKIIENNQGLLIDFELLGTSVNDLPVTNSLLADVGFLDAGQSAMVSWAMQSSLNGEFVSFSADFVHSDALGGQLTSLIDSPIDTHALLHKVKVDLPGRDQISDFLAFDGGFPIYDGDVLRVYESDGGQTVVANQTSSTAVTNLGVINGQQKYQVNFTPVAGASFARWDDPYDGDIQDVIAFRSDGKLLPPENIWQYRIETDPGVFERFFGLFDVDSTGQYEIIIDGAAPNVAPVITVNNMHTGEAGALLTFDIDVADGNPGDVLSVVSIGAPATSVVNFVSGSTWRFSWVPELADVGTVNFVLTASDGTLQISENIQLTITQPSAVDSDNDGMADDWEQQHFGNLDQTADGDFDLDSATNIQEHDFGGDPQLEDRPQTPEIVSPINYALIANDPLEFTVVNAIGAVDANMAYEFELYEHRLSNTPLASTTINEGTIQTSWLHGQTLQENSSYIWRVRAFDGVTASQWNYDGFVYSSIDEVPELCAVEFPQGNQSIAELRPELSVISASDVDSENLSYRFQIYSDAALTALVSDSNWLAGQENLTNKWKPYMELLDGQTYYWTANVKDDINEVSCGDSSFTIDTQYVLPQGYMLGAPQLNGVTDTAVDLIINHDINAPNAVDYGYYFEIDESRSFASPALVQSAAVSVDINNQAVWSVNHLLSNTDYYWRARAEDINGQGRWVYGQFTTTQTALEQKIIDVNPSNDSWVATLTPELNFYFDESANDVTNYVVDIYADKQANTLISSHVVSDTVLITPTLLDRNHYYWQVKAVLADGSETASTSLQHFYTIDDAINEMPYFEFVSLATAEENTTETYHIQWLDQDGDSNASISLYYDTDAVGADGTLITDNLSEDDRSNSHLWDIAPLPEGFYFIYAIIDDGQTSSTVYSDNSLLIVHHAIEATTSSTTTSESGDSVIVSVSLSKAPQDYVVVPITVSNINEAASSVSQLVFTPDNWNMTQQFTVTGVDDALEDGNQLYDVVLGPFDSFDQNYAQLASVVLSFSNTDDDTNGNFIALEALYNSTAGANWTNNTNWLVGDPCLDNWYGVVCDASNTNVTELNLGNNNLIGNLPAQIGQLIQLTRLNLYANQLSGALPVELGSLTNLISLALYNNDFSGTIPVELGNLTQLQYLFLSNNQLVGEIPSSLGNLTQMIHLTMINNQLSGSLPSSLGNLSQLEKLYLTNNDISGEIPLEFFQIIGLQELKAENNALTGSIPAEFGLMNNLTSLLLAGNQFSGVIPPELGNLSSLLYLDIGLNDITGAIPPELFNLTQLKTLKLYSNGLTGDVPVQLGQLTELTNLQIQGNNLSGDILSIIGTLDGLQYVFLNNNQFHGAIPTSLANLTNLNFLYLQGNRFNGDIPAELAQLTSLGSSGLNISFNKLSTNDPLLDASIDAMHAAGGNWSITQTIAPMNLSIANTTATAVTLTWDAIEFTAQTGRYSVYYSPAGVNNFVLAGSTIDKATNGFTVTGLDTDNVLYDFKVVSETDAHNSNNNDLVSNDSEVVSTTASVDPQYLALESLYNNTAGINWTNNSNWLVGDPCVDNWHGVACDTTNSHVIRLNLSSNNLVGTLPTQLGALSHLTQLILQGNMLSGDIPSELGQLSSLELLWLNNNQLSGSIPLELGNLGQLKKLHLQVNQLNGNIPNELGNMNNLENLYLSNNQLSGTIPVGLAQLSNLRQFNLGINQLSGSIPDIFAGMPLLTHLQLHQNALTGVIPDSIGSASELVYLFLFANQLTGSIPPQIGALNKLRELQLHGNNLTGAIPVELGNLTNLTKFMLYDNQLTGNIPEELGQLSNVILMLLFKNDLTGNIPASFGLLNNMTHLQMYENQLSGSIPAALGSAVNLKYLYLNNNNLSGTIPVEIGNLTNMINMALHYNQLQGGIPSTIGNLSSMTHFYLHFNQLDGTIPIQLGNLGQLKYFSVNGNNLIGEIPASLINLTSISAGGLNLHWNALRTDDAVLDSFLDGINHAGNWSGSQTIPVNNLSIDSVTSDTISLSWDAIEYQANGGFYEVNLAVSGTNNYSVVGNTTSKAVTTFEITGLDTVNNDYDIKLISITSSHPNNLNEVRSEDSTIVSTLQASALDLVIADVVSEQKIDKHNASFDTKGKAVFTFVGPGEVMHTYESLTEETNSYGPGLHEIVIETNAITTWDEGLLFLNVESDHEINMTHHSDHWLYLTNDDRNRTSFDSIGNHMANDQSKVGSGLPMDFNPYISPYYDKVIMPRDLAMDQGLNYVQLSKVYRDNTTLISQIKHNLDVIHQLRSDMVSGLYTDEFNDLQLFKDIKLMDRLESNKAAVSHISRSDYLDREDVVLAEVSVDGDSNDATSFKTAGFASFVFVGPGTIDIRYEQTDKTEKKVFKEGLYRFSINDNAITTWSDGKLFLNAFPSVELAAHSSDYYMYVPSFVAGQVIAYSDKKMIIADESGQHTIRNPLDSADLEPGSVMIDGLNSDGRIIAGNINKYLSPYADLMLMPKDVADAEGLKYTTIEPNKDIDQELILQYVDEVIEKLQAYKWATFYYQFQ